MATKVITKLLPDGTEVEITVHTDDSSLDETDCSDELIHNAFRRRWMYRKAGILDSPTDNLF